MAVKVLTHSDNSREAEQFRHGACPDAMSINMPLLDRIKQLNDAYYCRLCLK